MAFLSKNSSSSPHPWSRLCPYLRPGVVSTWYNVFILLIASFFAGYNSFRRPFFFITEILFLDFFERGRGFHSFYWSFKAFLPRLSLDKLYRPPYSPSVIASSFGLEAEPSVWLGRIELASAYSKYIKMEQYLEVSVSLLVWTFGWHFETEPGVLSSAKVGKIIG